MLEIYKCLNAENPSFMWNIFQTKDVAYNLRTKNLLQLPSANTLSYGNDSLSFRGAILGNTLSDSIKILATSASFKRSIKEWKGDNCSCKICRYRVLGNFTRSVFAHDYLQIVISFSSFCVNSWS